MFAKMCLLQTIPGAFNSYTPPTGMNVSWYWDFENKEEGQVIAFFTTQEISIHDYDVLPQGSIQKEIKNNRCFALVKVIPQKDWNKVIPGFTYQGQELNIPKDHPAVKPEWIPKEKKKIHKFMKDGKEETTEELLEYESDVDSDFLDELNELRIKNKLPAIQHGSEKVSKKSKKDGDIHSKEKIKIEWIKVLDEIKEEK